MVKGLSRPFRFCIFNKRFTNTSDPIIKKKKPDWICTSCVYLFRWHVEGVMDLIQHRIYDCVICTSVLPLHATFSGLAVELATHRLLLLWEQTYYGAHGIHPICLRLCFWSSHAHIPAHTHTHAQFVRKVSHKSALAVTNGLGSEGKPFRRWIADRSKTLSFSLPWLRLTFNLFSICIINPTHDVN